MRTLTPVLRPAARLAREAQGAGYAVDIGMMPHIKTGGLVEGDVHAIGFLTPSVIVHLAAQGLSPEDRSACGRRVRGGPCLWRRLCGSASAWGRWKPSPVLGVG